MRNTWKVSVPQHVFDFELALAASGGRFVDWRMGYDQHFQKGDLVEVNLMQEHKNVYVMQIVEIGLALEDTFDKEQYWPDKEAYYDGFGSHRYARLHLIRHDYESLGDVVKKESETQEELTEGTIHRVESNRYERNREARQKCIEANGCRCAVCGMSFEEKYGEIGRGFIHVHHVVPISSIGQDYVVDPLKDLVPVCPNCHNMLHRKDPPLSIEELKWLLK